MNRRAFLRRSPDTVAVATSELHLDETFFPRWEHPPRVAPPSPPAPLAINAGLEPYAQPLDRRRAAHLLRRTGFGAHAESINALTGMTADAAVDALVDDAINQEPPRVPDWVDAALPRPPGRGATPAEREQYQQEIRAYIEANAEWYQEYRMQWYAQMYYGGLREKMTLFWSNHFVTEAASYNRLAIYAYRYVSLLRTHALGNFRQFVHDIGLDGAMLVYLNGNESEIGAPNENYARELLELFTMSQESLDGTLNYTQQDIEEIARALTGWVVDPYILGNYPIPSIHDPGAKTIFGQTLQGSTDAAEEYARLMDLLFAQRARPTAEYICEKIYQYFVYAGAPADVVSDLADVFLANDFQIAPVLRTLFKSAHFYDSEGIGAQIKSPIEELIGTLRELGVEQLAEDQLLLLDRYARFLNQVLLSPPNVAGWPGYHSWLDTTTLPLRWLISEAQLFGNRGRDPLNLIALAEKIHDPNDSLAAFRLPLALAEHLLAVPLEDLNIDPPDEGFAGDLANFPIPQEVLEGPAYARDLAIIFLSGVPWYEWNLFLDESNPLLLLFTRYLTQIPEYQLT